MTTFTGFIDPPGSFADPDEWRVFVEELGRLPRSPEVDRAIEDARSHMTRAASTGSPASEEDDFSDLEDPLPEVDSESGEG